MNDFIKKEWLNYYAIIEVWWVDANYYAGLNGHAVRDLLLARWGSLSLFNQLKPQRSSQDLVKILDNEYTSFILCGCRFVTYQYSRFNLFPRYVIPSAYKERFDEFLKTEFSPLFERHIDLMHHIVLQCDPLRVIRSGVGNVYY